MNVSLIGMKYSGKSTVGEALAARWGCPFLDTDALIEGAHARRTGETLSTREIFAAGGEAYFGRMEADVVKGLASETAASAAGRVVSVGGRTPLNEAAAPLLRQIGVVVYLYVPLETLLERLAAAPTPAFLRAETAAEDFSRLFDRRRPVYERIAELTVPVGSLSVDEAVERVATTVEEYENAR